MGEHDAYPEGYEAAIAYIKANWQTIGYAYHMNDPLAGRIMWLYKTLEFRQDVPHAGQLVAAVQEWREEHDDR